MSSEYKSMCANLTGDELLDLRNAVLDEISNLDNRGKREVYVLTIYDVGSEYFTTQKLRNDRLLDMISDGEIESYKELKLHQRFFSDADINKYCDKYEC